MYEEHDVLQEVLDRARLPAKVPEKGGLKIAEVLKADYAFA
jgi:hypothetical protein